MADRGRESSESGYYHVAMRGVGRQFLFEDDEERRFFLRRLKRYTSEYEIAVIAWCLMDNHVHLLLNSPEGALSPAMRKLGISFAEIHNKTADHVGHVFQGRFKSVPIETDGQLLACLRYIHDNPQKAGFCQASAYPWSSYHEYVDGTEIANTRVILSMLDGVAGFREFSAETPCSYDVSFESARMGTAEARETMNRAISPAEYLALREGPRSMRNEALGKLKRAGLSVRQIERLTGIGRNIIQRANESNDRII